MRNGLGCFTNCAIYWLLPTADRRELQIKDPRGSMGSARSPLAVPSPTLSGMYTRRQEFIGGVRSETPLAVGVVPFAMIYGALATAVGINALPAMLMSSIVFAGASQFVGTRLIGSGANPALIIFTTFIVNLRHALYSVALAPDVQGLSRSWRFLLAYLLTDEAYAGAVARYARRDSPETRHWFLFGTGLTLWTTWQVSTAAGIFLGASVPASWALEFTLALTFIGIVVPTLRNLPAVGAALTAAAVAVATVNLPYGMGLVLAALSGISAGMLLAARQGAVGTQPVEVTR